ncbi:hypothetical protein [Streptomyces atratus]|nr:hypothetical protein [Streptomyces atratus]
MGLALELAVGVVLWACARHEWTRAIGFFLALGAGLMLVLKAVGVQ